MTLLNKKTFKVEDTNVMAIKFRNHETPNYKHRKSAPRVRGAFSCA